MRARGPTAALLLGLLAACAGGGDSRPAQQRQAAPRGAAAAAPLPQPTADALLEAHNRWRKTIPVPPLRWSSEAADQALIWAATLDEGCRMRHNPDPVRKKRFGENLYAYWASSPYQGYRATPEQVVRRWAEESKWYDATTHRCHAPKGKTCGHYTQLVWTYSKSVGCARAHCNTSEVWVCNYTPRGNMIGVAPY